MSAAIVDIFGDGECKEAAREDVRENFSGMRRDYYVPSRPDEQRKRVRGDTGSMAARRQKESELADGHRRDCQ